ncbi:MAG: hypothetical protein IPK71_07250 [Myxococcales bacterium]|nr:hypothetical protein [Myxococcales bacterium]
MSPGRLALVAQLASTLPLVGLTWLVQVLVYPQLARVGASEFPAYHAAHARLVTYVVAPLMVTELMASLGGLAAADPVVPRWLAAVGAGLAIATWAATFFLAVPQHAVLSRGFDPRAHELLLAANALRTALWSLRGVLVVGAVARALPE